MTATLPFRTWLRRARTDDPASLAIRFEVFDGKGVLRVARPGILIDPPARVSGFEDRLTPAQVRASRFLHVWAGGRKRQSHILSRLTDDDLLGIEAEAWVEMTIASDGGYRYLQLPGGGANRPKPVDRQGRPLAPLPNAFDEEDVTEVRAGLMDPAHGSPPGGVDAPSPSMFQPQRLPPSPARAPLASPVVPGTFIPAQPQNAADLPATMTASPPSAVEQVAEVFLRRGEPPPTVLIRVLRRALERQRLELMTLRRTSNPVSPAPYATPAASPAGPRNLARPPAPMPPQPKVRGFDDDDDDDGGRTQIRPSIK